MANLFANMPLIPRAKIERNSGSEARLDDTKTEPVPKKLSIVACCSHGSCHSTPDEVKPRQAFRKKGKRVSDRMTNVKKCELTSKRPSRV